MFDTFRIYLSGGIKGHTYSSCNNWREEVDRRLYSEYVGSRLRTRPVCLSPMRGKPELQDMVEVNHAATHDLSVYKNQIYNDGAITARDRQDVATCDMVLVHVLGDDRISIGTCIEIGWADAYRKPVILVAEPDSPYTQHPIVGNIAVCWLDSLDDAIDVIKRWI